MAYWKLTLAYDGTAFHGWQVQPERPTIQGTLAAALARLTGETVLPQGSGRTDAGVHALAQVCSFSLRSPVPPANLERALNRLLPAAIRVLRVETVPATFHARHSALRKTYRYQLFERSRPQADGTPADRLCSPFIAPFVWDVRWPLDLAAMQSAAALVCGTYDFTSFAATDPDRTSRHAAAGQAAAEPADPAPPDAVRTLSHSAWQAEHDQLVYTVTGNGFLHHMVRNLVGTFVEVGRSRFNASSLPGILAARDRGAAGPTAPARGLFLVSVEYGDAPTSVGVGA